MINEMKFDKSFICETLKDDKSLFDVLNTKDSLFFKYVVEYLESNLYMLVNEKTIDKILSYPYDKLDIIMKSDNPYKNVVLNNSKAIKKICDVLNRDIYYMGEPFTQGLAMLIIDRSISVNNLEFLSENELYRLLENKKTCSIEKILQYKLEVIPTKILNELIKNDKFISNILNLPLNIINQLVVNGLIIPEIIYTDSDFVLKYISMYDIELFRIYAEHLANNNIYFYKYVNSKMFEKYDYIMNNIDDEGIFSEYRNLYIKLKSNDYNVINIPKSIYDIVVLHMTFGDNITQDVVDNNLSIASSILMLDILIDKYFCDCRTNVLLNLKMIVDFDSNVNVIPKDRLENYKKILKYNDLSLIEKKNLYLNMNCNYKQHLYDDMRLLKDISYDMLNSSFLNFEREEYNLVKGVKVYELSGKDFCIPIHLTSARRDLVGDLWRNDSFCETLSVSIISNNNLNTYYDPRSYFALGFNKLDKSKIMHVYDEDSYSMGRIQLDKVNCIYTPDLLIEKTLEYNEILLYEDETLVPSYMVCYDNICENDIIKCKQMDIPLVLIDTKYYKTKEKEYNNPYNNSKEKYKLY